MTFKTTETPLTIHPVCVKEVSSMRSSRSDQYTITKVSTRCGLFNTSHFACAKQFSIKIKKDYEFDSESYINYTSSPLLCVNYNEFCFHCDKRHNITNKVDIFLCVKYKAK